MKTRCPNCHTAFRITPEQLKARVGKVRCGQCQTVFNALDSLLDGAETTTAAPARPAGGDTPAAAPAAPANPALTATPAATAVVFVSPYVASVREAANEALTDEASAEQEASADQQATAEPIEPAGETPPAPVADEEEPVALSESEAQELGKATGLIMPRETTAIPGYSKWGEGMMTGAPTAPLSLPNERASRWPFVVVAMLLVVALAGQVVFHFRSEISVAAPSLKPLLAAASQALGAELPLPRRVELVSIETSDLQSDPAAQASGRPCTVSWSVRAMALSPAARAAATSSAGFRVPSDAVEWVWRSISGMGQGYGRGRRMTSGDRGPAMKTARAAGARAADGCERCAYLKR